MLQLDRWPVREILFRRPRGEFAEQRSVGFRRVVRLPALVAQVLQKIFDEGLHQNYSPSLRRRSRNQRGWRRP